MKKNIVSVWLIIIGLYHSTVWTMEDPCKLIFICDGNRTFTIERKLLQESMVIKNQEFLENNDLIALSRLQFIELANLQLYLQQRKELSNDEKTLKKYHKQIPYETLLSLLKSLYYLEITPLYPYLTETTADRYINENANKDVTNFSLINIDPPPVKDSIARALLKKFNAP